MIRFLVGAGMALFALVLAFLLEGGGATTLLGASAFTITFFMPFFGVLAIWRFSDWRRAWRHAFQAGEKTEALVSVEIWKFTEFACFLAGVLGSLVGGILILTYADWANASRVGASFAAALIAPLYGTTFGFVARILRARVESLHP